MIGNPTVRGAESHSVPILLRTAAERVIVKDQNRRVLAVAVVALGILTMRTFRKRRVSS